MRITLNEGEQMEKVRVLQFPFSANNGVTAYATNNWTFMDRTKIQCDFAVVRKSFDLAWEEKILQMGGGIQHILYSQNLDEARYIEQLSKLLRGNYDVVHLHTSFWKRLLIEQIAADCRIPRIIVHAHNTGVDYADDAVRQAAEKKHYELRAQIDESFATDFCACSMPAADWLFGDRIPASKVKIMKNAIDVDQFLFNQSIRDAYRKALGLEGCFVIGHIGRFSHQKNQEFLVDVLAKVCETKTNARLLFVGEGEQEPAIREKVRRLKLTDQVIFAGQRSDVPGLMQAMDLFCLPSRFEGLGIVLVEAQAAGLQCLASEQIVDEVCITDHISRLPFNVDCWAEAVIERTNGYKRECMYDAVTEAGYNIKFQIKEIENLYSGM